MAWRRFAPGWDGAGGHALLTGPGNKAGAARRVWAISASRLGLRAGTNSRHCAVPALCLDLSWARCPKSGK